MQASGNSFRLNIRKVDWVELRCENGFQKFAEVLNALKIAHGEMLEVTEENLEIIFNEIMK